MPSPHHHYYLRTFMQDLKSIDPYRFLELQELEKREDELLQEAYKLRQERIQAANTWLQEHADRIRPVLRPCHQRRLDEGKLDVEPNIL